MATYFFDSTPAANGFGTVGGNWLGSATWTQNTSGASGTNVQWPAGNAASFGSAGLAVVGGTLALTTTVSLTGISVLNSTGDVTISGAGGTLAFGANAAAFATPSANLWVNSAITGSNGLSKSGSALLFLKGATTGLTGAINVQAGGSLLVFQPVSSLGSSVQVLSASNTATIASGTQILSRPEYSPATLNFANNFSGAGMFAHQGDAVPSPIDPYNAITNVTGSLSSLSAINVYGFGVLKVVDLPYDIIQFQAGFGYTNVLYITANSTISTNAVIQLTGDTASTSHFIGGFGSSPITIAGGIKRIDANPPSPTPPAARNIILAGSGTGTYTINGDASTLSTGATTLEKADTGLWVLGGDNSALSSTLISNGTLRGTNNNAFAKNVTMNAGTVLEVANNITVSNAINSQGTIRNISGSNALSGTITLAAGTTFESQSGTLTVSGVALTGVGQPIELAGAGNTKFAKSIQTTSGTVLKSGTGTATLSATDSNYTGKTTINGGVLEAALLQPAGTASSIGSGSILELSGSGVLRNTGIISVNFNRTASGTVSSGGFGNTASSTLAVTTGSLNGVVALEATQADSQFNQLAISVGNTGTAGGFTKTGAGRWISTNNNDLTGNTSVSAGTLMADYNGWNVGTKLLGANVTVAANAKIQTGGGTNQKGRNSYTSLTFNGTVGNPARIRIGGASTNPMIFLNGDLVLPTGSDKVIFDLSADVFKTRGTYRLIEFAAGKGVTGGSASANIGFTGLRSGLTATFRANPSTSTSLPVLTVTIS